MTRTAKIVSVTVPLHSGISVGDVLEFLEDELPTKFLIDSENPGEVVVYLEDSGVRALRTILGGFWDWYRRNRL